MSQLSSAREDCDSELNFEQGKVIGNYILGKTIGKGTFGKVKLGTHILTGEKLNIIATEYYLYKIFTLKLFDSIQFLVNFLMFIYSSL